MTGLLWSFAAWCSLAHAIERHRDQALRPGAGRMARGAWAAFGTAGMGAALAATVGVQGWALGVLTWVGAAAVSGAVTAALLAWRPRWCLQAALAAVLLGAALAA